MSSEISDLGSGKTLGIIQSNYIPWKGYFDFIASVDEFVLLDDVRYSHHDWRNRNKIKTKDGLRWLTIPVDTKGQYGQTIDQTQVTNHYWIDDHLRSLRHSYARAPYFKREWPWIEELYESVRSTALLSAINEQFLRAIAGQLRIETPIRLSREFSTTPGKNERIIAICRAAGASRYLSGPAAKAYIDPALWSSEGISVEYMSYDRYPEYPQLHGEFEHGVTVFDVFFHIGPAARSYIVTVNR